MLGSSFWVPPRPSSSNLVDLVHKLTNDLTDEESLSPSKASPPPNSSSKTGKLLKESHKEFDHKKTITSLTKSTYGSHFLSGSLDKSARGYCRFLINPKLGT